MKRSTTRKVKGISYQILAILFASFMLIPIYQAVITALTSPSAGWVSPAPLVPTNVTFSNFINAFHLVQRLPIYLLNSFIYGIGVSLFSLIIAIPAGYSLARFKYRLKSPMMFFVIYANMFAPIMLLVPLYVIMKAFGLINTYWSMILAGSVFTIPLSTWLSVSYMQTIPVEIEEAALMDGCTPYSILPRIVIPLMKPALVAIFIYAFITGWSQQFTLALVLISNDKMMPVTQGLYQFFSRSSVSWGPLMAAILISTLIPVVLFLLVEKYIVQGLTSGSIK